jgi:hypothetical protein
LMPILQKHLVTSKFFKKLLSRCWRWGSLSIREKLPEG